MPGLLQIIVGFIFCGAVFGAPAKEIHHDMTPEERFQVFNTVGTDVPTYEIVKIHSSKIEKRAINKIQMFQFKYNRNKITAWLTSHTGVLATDKTPVYFATTVRNKSVLKKQNNVMKKVIGWLYENKAQAITMSIRKSHNGRIKMNGVIRSKNVHVRSIPDRLIESMHRYKRSIDDDDDDNAHLDHDHSYHIVYEIPKLAYKASSAQRLYQKSLKNPSNIQKFSGSSLKNPEIVYPELLITVDFHLYEILGRNLEEALSYLLAFWNGVDMYYRPLRRPRYLLNIAGVIIAQDAKALEYIKTYREVYVNAGVTLDETGKWLEKHKKLIPGKNYDAVITMTGRAMQTKNETGHYFDVLGLAYLGGICNNYNEFYGTMWKTAIIRDLGGFYGILAGAHELGHLFGAEHDVDYSECEKVANTIMTSNRTSDLVIPTWSKCSLKAFEELFETNNLTCLYNKPAKGEAVPRLLPGKLVSPDQQCKDVNKNTYAVVNKDFCKNMRCNWYLNDIKYLYGPYTITAPAADGTQCEPNKICFQGVCTNETLVMS